MAYLALFFATALVFAEQTGRFSFNHAARDTKH